MSKSIASAYPSLSWGLSDSYDFGETIKDRVRMVGNEIYFTSEVDAESIDRLVTLLVESIDSGSGNNSLVRREGPVKVVLYIDSPGGLVKDCFKFVDTVDMLKRAGRLHLTTVSLGMVASAGTLMACIGNERYVTPNTICMIHELFGGNVGTYTKLTSGMKCLAHLHETIISIYLKNNSKISRDKLTDYLAKETWFTAEEYVNEGFADGLYANSATSAK